jgi:hypothetical protein
VKKFSWLAISACLVCAIGFGISSCKKINEATDLGGSLVPAVDNINTFETFLDVETDNQLYNDTSLIYASDELALGHISNDAEFGQTHGDIYFNIGPRTYNAYPFFNKDSIIGIDSTVLTLALTNIQGDSNQAQTAKVYEIDQNAAFVDSILYPVFQPDFAVGPELGSRNYTPKGLRDSIVYIRGRDTSKTVNVLRVPLAPNSSLVSKLVNGTAAVMYRNYGLFYNNVRGLAIKATNSGNALSYFNLLDTAHSKLIVYYRVHRNGLIDTTSTSFYHGLVGAGVQNASGLTDGSKARGGQANIIRRIPGGSWATYLANPSTNEDRIYMQSDPGTVANIRIPGLDTLTNRVIHRAELVAKRITTSQDALFPAIPTLFLARYSGTKPFNSLEDDSLSVDLTTGIFSSSIFGGVLRDDNTYRWNISRHVQQIVTRHKPNDPLRILAPMRYSVPDLRYAANNYLRPFQVLPRIAWGRTVLGGGNNADPNVKMRLRIVYSKL